MPTVQNYKVNWHASLNEVNKATDESRKYCSCLYRRTDVNKRQLVFKRNLFLNASSC